MIIIRDITRTKKKEAALRELSIQDSLTGLYNHSYFINQLTKEIHRSYRYLHTVSLLMIDIDDFKKYNDTHGHLKGDRLLVKVAKMIRNKVRSIDFVARYGGEEFSVILLETDKKAAFLTAEKLRKEVRRRFLAGPTISIGVATCPEDATKAQSLIKKADQALYLAKNSGKDLVRVFTVE